MTTPAKDLTTDELRDLIAAAVTETMQDMMEDLLAISSPRYVQSIEQSRKDYQHGNIKSLDETLDV